MLFRPSIFAAVPMASVLLGSMPIMIAAAPAASATPYVKVCNSGDKAGLGVCPASPTQGPAANEWACTIDNATNLMWEVKTQTGRRAYGKGYTNYDNTALAQKSTGAFPTAAEIVAATNVIDYMTTVNASSLCGASNWRRPTNSELAALVVGTTQPAIDAAAFPWTTGGHPVQLPYTTTTNAVASPTTSLYMVSFYDGQTKVWPRDHPSHVRLVATSSQQCQTLIVDESNPWATAGKITLPGSPKTLVSITGSYTVAAANGLPSETKAILNPPPSQPNQRKAGPYPLSLSNKYLNTFMLPNPTPLPPISQSGAANYVTMNQPLVTGSYLVPGMSVWPDNTIHAHGKITGTVTLCVQ